MLTLYSIVYLVFLLPAVYGLGSSVKNSFKAFSCYLQGIFVFSFGLAVYALMVTLLGSYRLFYVPGIALIVGILFVLTLKRLPSSLKWCSDVISFFVPESKAEFFFITLLLFSYAFSLVLCTLPEIANDSLCYQLHIPKLYVRYHSLLPMENEINSYMPALWNYLYATALLFKSVFAAKFLHWLTALLLDLAFMFYLHQKKVSRIWVLSLGLIFFLTPTLWNQMTSTYVDAATSLYLFLSLILVVEFLGELDDHAYMVSGLFFGMAVAIKLTTLIALPGLLLLILVSGIMNKQFSHKIRVSFFFLCGSTMAACYWFLRNWSLEGNPVYPYMGQLFGTKGMHNLSSYLENGVGKTPLNFILVLWHMTVRPTLFDRGHWIGPFYLVSLPFVFYAFKSKTRCAVLFGIFFLSYALFWFLFAQNARYLLPALAPFAIVAGFGLSEFYSGLKSQGRKKGMVFLAGGLAACLFIFGLFHYRYQMIPLLHRDSFDRYLTKTERSYSMAVWMNNHLPPKSKVLNAEEIRQFYFEPETVRWNIIKIHHPYQGLHRPESLIRDIKRLGFTHILRAKNISRPSFQDDNLLRLLDLALGDVKLVKSLISMDSQNRREDRYRYALYMIEKGV